jgi:cellobiose-specific phosphotransferase system component IIC
LRANDVSHTFGDASAMTPNSIWDFWRWAFARTYLRDKRRWGESPASLWSAITNVSINMSFNLLALAAAFAWALRLPTRTAHPRELGLAVMAFALGANYLRFGRNGEAERLSHELDRSSEATRRAERGLFGYTVASFLAPVRSPKSRKRRR